MLNALTFDVEDYYHVSAFRSAAPSSSWDRYESRVERNTHNVLEILSKFSVRATFFVLGWVAERYPQLVQAISNAGHEIACHGYGHDMVTQLNPDTFRHDIRRGKGLLEDLLGYRILGYRAPSFTITLETVWALSILAEEGFAYDSSIVPIWHDRYGIPHANPFCHRLETESGPLWEVPPSTFALGRMRIPIAGGGYFRFFPYRVLRALLKRVEGQRVPLVMYLHPWELDPQQPRIQGSQLSQFRHYHNLDKTERRLIQLLQDFKFGPIREAIAPIADMMTPDMMRNERPVRKKEHDALVRG
jgi:polysaccharide deacetylase family protein (PEP-CTERM system associated)